MRIATFDIGVGTIDILIWDSKDKNIYKMVMPSPLQIIANKIRKVNNRDLLIDGIEMGGFPVSSAILEHIEKGFKVYMVDPCWKTIKYDKDLVINKGIEIINESMKDEILKNKNIELIYLTDLNIEYFFKIFEDFNIRTDFDYIGIAVQDHGVPIKNTSSTNFRREWIVNILKEKPYFNSFLFKYNEVPDYLSRSKSLANYIYKKTSIPVYITDTVIAASKGCLYHENIKMENIVGMDIGNGHTCAFSISNGEIYGYFEFHTNNVTKDNLRWAVLKLVDGSLTNEEIIEKKGHGAFIRKKLKRPYQLIVTGPHRYLIKGTGLDYVYGTPFGDNMITGAVGLLKLILEKIEFK